MSKTRGKREKRNCKQLVTTYGSIDISLALFTKGITSCESSALSRPPCSFMFMSFGMLSIICIQSIERHYYDNDKHCLVNTGTIPKSGSHKGPLGGCCPLCCGIHYLTLSFTHTQLAQVI